MVRLNPVSVSANTKTGEISNFTNLGMYLTPVHITSCSSQLLIKKPAVAEATTGGSKLTVGRTDRKGFKHKMSSHFFIF